MPFIQTTVDRGSSRNTQLSDLFINTLIIGEMPEGIINITQPTRRVTKPIDTGTSVLDRAQRATIKAANYLVGKIANRASVEVAIAQPTPNYTSVTVGATTVSPVTLSINGTPYTATWSGSTIASATEAIRSLLLRAGLIIYSSDTATGVIGVVSQDESPFSLTLTSGLGVTFGSTIGNSQVLARDYVKTINQLAALDVGDLPVGFLIMPSAYTKFNSADCHQITAAANILAEKHNLVLLVDTPNPDLLLQSGVDTGSAYTIPSAHAQGSIFNYGGTVYRVDAPLAVTTAINGAAYPLNSLVYLASNGKTYRSLSPSATFADVATPTEAELLTFVEERPLNIVQRWINIGGLTAVDRGYNSPEAYVPYANEVPKGLDGQCYIYLNYWGDGTGETYPPSILVAGNFIKTWITSNSFLVNHAGSSYPVSEVASLVYSPKDADLASAKNYNYLSSKGNFHIAGVRSNSIDDKFRWITGSITVAMVRRQTLVAAASIQYQPLQGVSALLGGVRNTFVQVLESLAGLFFDRQYRVIADLSNNTLDSLQAGLVNVKVCIKLSPDIDEIALTVAVKALSEEL